MQSPSGRRIPAVVDSSIHPAIPEIGTTAALRPLWRRLSSRIIGGRTARCILRESYNVEPRVACRAALPLQRFMTGEVPLNSELLFASNRGRTNLSWIYRVEADLRMLALVKPRHSIEIPLAISPQTLLFVPQERREHVFDDAPLAGLDIDRNRHAGRAEGVSDKLVQDLFAVSHLGKRLGCTHKHTRRR